MISYRSLFINWKNNMIWIDACIQYSLLKNNILVYIYIEGNVTSSSNRSKWLSPNPWIHGSITHTTSPFLVPFLIANVWYQCISINWSWKNIMSKKRSFQFPPSSVDACKSSNQIFSVVLLLFSSLAAGTSFLSKSWWLTWSRKNPFRWKGKE